MAPKSSSSEGPAADGRTPFQKFDDLAHQLFPAVKPITKRTTKTAKPKQKKSRH